MKFAPPWALFGGIVDGGPLAPNPHLRSGVHLHVLPAGLLGLPATPLFVSRFGVIGDSIAGLEIRNDIRWVKANGQEITPPFDPDPQDPIIGWLPGPPSGTCVWIEVEVTEVIGGPPEILAAAAPAAAAPAKPWGIEAWVSNAQGASLVGFAPGGSSFSAPRIDFIVIRPGIGVSVSIEGVSWLALEDVPLSRFTPWRTWSLPVDPAFRYQPTATAHADADARVSAGASPHRPLFIDPVDGGPSASVAQTPAEETARITKLRTVTEPLLDQLVATTAPPSQVSSPPEDVDQLPGSASFPLLGHVLQAGLDPGMARWLGFADVDDAPPVTEFGDLVFYLVRALWPEDPTRTDAEKEQLSLLSSSLVQPGPALIASFPGLANLGPLPTASARFYDLAIILVASLGEGSAPPLQPVSNGILDKGWRPDVVVPNALRVVAFPMSGLVPAAAIAFDVADKTAPNPTDRSLNPRLGNRQILLPGDDQYQNALPLPLAAAVPQGGAPDGGTFEDRSGFELGGNYRIAQADWFGRWSEWARIAVPAWQRTPPPAPTLELHYQVPTLDPADLLPEAGTFSILVPVPDPTSLPAGGRLLVDIAITMIVDGTPVANATFPLPLQAGTSGGVTLDPAPSPDAPGLLRIPFTGPALPPAGGASVTFVGTWGDGAQRSPEGTATRRISDPRPLPPPVMPADLIYAQRPDARGQARLELPLPPGAPPVRIYYTTETTILRALELLAAGGGPNAADAQTAHDEIQAAAIGSPRAQACVKWKRLFDYTMFENVTVTPFQGVTFPHVLSASLQVLALYRVLSVSPSGVLSDFVTSPLVAAMVPNFDPPPRPLLKAVLDTASPTPGVELDVRVSTGAQPPIAVRVRRASHPQPDPRQIPVVHTGNLPGGASPPSSWLTTPITTDTQGMSFSLLDPGPFINWRRYFWAVEVQGSPPPGAPATGFVPVGEWSLVSSPVHADIIPPIPPSAPDVVLAQRLGPDVVVTVQTSGPLAPIGTTLGSFTVEIYRSVPGARPISVAGPVEQPAAGQFTVTDAAAPDQSTYAARVVDPLGRRSDITTSIAPV